MLEVVERRERGGLPKRIGVEGRPDAVERADQLFVAHPVTNAQPCEPMNF